PEAVGPIATNELVTFVGLVANKTVVDLHRNGSTFALRQLYDLTDDYPRARPLFDWIGVRYIVLDKAIFNDTGRLDHQPLLDPASGMRVAYDDDTVTILESPTAQSKAFFTTRVREASEASTLAQLRTNPAAVEQGVTVEADLGDVMRADPNGLS